MNHTSIVHELQNMASSDTGNVVSLLRKAMLVSSKLDLNDITTWLNHELNGYPNKDAVPDYRSFTGSFEIELPMQGGRRVPVVIQGDDTQSIIETVKITDSISQVQELSQRDSDVLALVPPKSLLNALADDITVSFDKEMIYLAKVYFSKSKLTNILESVQSLILAWALDLENKGVLGNGLSFDVNEKAIAQHSTVIQIQGNVLGHVVGTNTGTIGSIANSSQAISAVEESGLPSASIDAFKSLATELEGSEDCLSKLSIKSKLHSWLVDNSVGLASLSAQLAQWINSVN